MKNPHSSRLFGAHFFNIKASILNTRAGIFNIGASISICLALTISNPVNAAGFAIVEQNASGIGTAYAGGAAITEDASVVHTNPAGMINLKGKQTVAAAHTVAVAAEFTNEGSTAAAILGSPVLSGDDSNGGRVALIPNFYITTPYSKKIALGLGVNAPFGLATQYDDDWVGRYHAVESALHSLNINPSFAYSIDSKLSLGFGLNIQRVDVTLSNAIDFGAVCYAAFGAANCATMNLSPQNNDGFVSLEGDNGSDIGLGWNVGVLYQISPKHRFGFSYRSEIDHDLEGNADFSVPSLASALTQSGTFTDSGISASVTLPQIASISMTHQITPAFNVMWDYTWTGWSSFDELRIVFDNAAQPESVTTENWQNSFRAALGATFRVNEKLLLRSGVAYDQSPIPNDQLRTARIPGNDRRWLSFGASISTADDILFDIAYSHLFISDTKINNTLESSVPTVQATLNGSYKASVNIFSAQVRWLF